MTSDADRVIEVYRRHGADWARDRGDRLIEGAWLDRFQALLPSDPSVLDLGCGSGRPIARRLEYSARTMMTMDLLSDRERTPLYNVGDQWPAHYGRTLRTFVGRPSGVTNGANCSPHHSGR